MPQPTKPLEDMQKQKVRTAWQKIHQAGAETYVDDNFVNTANDAAYYFDQAARSPDVGYPHVIDGMIPVYTRHSGTIKKGQICRVNIFTHPRGAINIE